MSFRGCSGVVACLAPAIVPAWCLCATKVHSQQRIFGLWKLPGLLACMLVNRASSCCGGGWLQTLIVQYVIIYVAVSCGEGLWGRVVGAAAWLQSGPHKRPDLLPAATIQRQGLLLMNFQVTQSVKKGARQPHCTVCQPAPCMLAFLGLWLCLMCPCCVGGSCECAEDREDMLHDRRASGECCIGYTGPLGSSCVSSV